MKQCGSLLTAGIIAGHRLGVIHTYFQGTLVNPAERMDLVHRLELFVPQDRQTADGEMMKSQTTGPYHRQRKRGDAWNVLGRSQEILTVKRLNNIEPAVTCVARVPIERFNKGRTVAVRSSGKMDG